MLNDAIKFYYDEYSEDNWLKFSMCFTIYEGDISEFESIPVDVIKVLVGLLGIESSLKWIRKELKLMDGVSAVELSKSEIGICALKSLILRMPN